MNFDIEPTWIYIFYEQEAANITFVLKSALSVWVLFIIRVEALYQFQIRITYLFLNNQNHTHFLITS